MSLLDRAIVGDRVFPEFASTSEINPMLLGITPGRDFFERFGIGYSASVHCRRGIVGVDWLNANDEIVTREKGFVRPIGVLKSERTFEPDAEPTVLNIERDFFGRCYPDSDLVTGSHVQMDVPIKRKDQKRPNMTHFDLTTFGRMFSKCRQGWSRLYVPVFNEAVSIKVWGRGY